METQALHVPAVRVHTSVLAAAEKRLLIRLARGMPGWVSSDHLTALSAVSLVGVGACFWAGSARPSALLLAIVFLFGNWFGDSLDGTLARVRRQERPRYGYYVDHVLDAVGFIWLLGGLTLGGFMSPIAALVFLVAYYLLIVEISLATHARGVFRMSFWKMGPTELRIVLAAGIVALFRSPYVSLLDTRWLLFDVGSAVATVGLIATFVVSAVRNGLALYAEERI